MKTNTDVESSEFIDWKIAVLIWSALFLSSLVPVGFGFQEFKRMQGRAMVERGRCEQGVPIERKAMCQEYYDETKQENLAVTMEPLIIVVVLGILLWIDISSRYSAGTAEAFILRQILRVTARLMYWFSLIVFVLTLLVGYLFFLLVADPETKRVLMPAFVLAIFLIWGQRLFKKMIFEGKRRVKGWLEVVQLAGGVTAVVIIPLVVSGLAWLMIRGILKSILH